MGTKGSKPKSSIIATKPVTDTARIKYDTLSWTEKGEIGFSMPTPPLLNGNDIIFLSTSNKSTIYKIYNLSTSTFSVKSQKIECDSDDFDVANTVYALNTDTNKIYFIENNKDIKVLDIETNKVTSLNKSISTKNDNVATIQYNNGNIYIIGGENYKEIDEETKEEKQYKSDECSEYIIIPYSTATKRASKSEELEVIKKSGLFARVLNIECDDVNCIYIIGGKKNYNNKGKEAMIYPMNSMWKLQLLDNKGKHDWRSKWKPEYHSIMQQCYTPQAMHSFAIINYNNIYLILFGGEIFNRDKVKTCQYIWISPLLENDEFGLTRNWWYKIYLKLPQKGHFHAIYPPKDNNKEDIVHLFSYDGKYYTIKMADIINKLKAKEFLKFQAWNGGNDKVRLPTKAISFTSLAPPKEDSAIDKLLDGLSETVDKGYGKYKAGFDNVDYQELEQIINDPEKKMDKIVENEEHRKVIIEKAKELMNAANIH